MGIGVIRRLNVPFVGLFLLLTISGNLIVLLSGGLPL